MNADFYLQPYLNGVKLAQVNDSNYPEKSKYLLENLFKNQFNIYFINHENVIVNANEEQAYSVGFGSVNSLIGKSIPDLIDDKKANIICNNNFEIIQNKIVKSFDEEIIDVKRELHIQSLSIKLPWFNDRNQVMGVFGCSFIIGRHQLAKSILEVASLGLLDHLTSSKKVISNALNDVHFSKREADCLYYAAKGKTAKESARILGISHRTVEIHIANVKQKLKVNSKKELIDNFLLNYSV